MVSFKLILSGQGLQTDWQDCINRGKEQAEKDESGVDGHMLHAEGVKQPPAGQKDRQEKLFI